MREGGPRCLLSSAVPHCAANDRVLETCSDQRPSEEQRAKRAAAAPSRPQSGEPAGGWQAVLGQATQGSWGSSRSRLWSLHLCLLARQMGRCCRTAPSARPWADSNTTCVAHCVLRAGAIPESPMQSQQVAQPPARNSSQEQQGAVLGKPLACITACCAPGAAACIHHCHLDLSPHDCLPLLCLFRSVCSRGGGRCP